MHPPPAAELLPAHYLSRIIAPTCFDRYDEPSARAVKVKGYAENRGICFYFHTYTLLEERFDCDDQPYQLATYVEHVVAWRLRSGKWLRRKLQRTLHEACCDQMEIVEEPAMRH